MTLITIWENLVFLRLSVLAPGLPGATGSKDVDIKTNYWLDASKKILVEEKVADYLRKNEVSPQTIFSNRFDITPVGRKCNS